MDETADTQRWHQRVMGSTTRRVIAAAIVVLLVGGGAVAIRSLRQDDGSPSAQQAARLAQAGVDVCLGTGLPKSTCNGLTSGGSSEPQPVRDWCAGLTELGVASARLAGGSAGADRTQLVTLVRSAAERVGAAAPDQVKSDAEITVRAINSVLDAYEGAAGGDLAAAAAAVPEDVQHEAADASSRLASYSSAHCA